MAFCITWWYSRASATGKTVVGHVDVRDGKESSTTAAQTRDNKERLHAELTEYTNLVRVLRTTRTLDLTAHLLHHAAQHTDTDTWTSWPLIDCRVPEWSLHDEIQHLAESVAHEDADSDSPSSHLVLHTGAVLVHILNLLADQRPSAPGSMQNRLWAMNREDVLSPLVVNGAVDPAYVLVRYRSRPYSS